MAILHPSAGHFCLGATRGWLDTRVLPVWDIHWRHGVGPLRLSYGSRGVFKLAAHRHANPGRNAARRLRPADAKLWHLEAKAGVDVAECDPLHCRLGDWRANRNDPAHLRRSSTSAYWSWHDTGAFR